MGSNPKAIIRTTSPAQLIPTLLLNFDLELTNPEKEWKTTCMYVCTSLLVAPAEPLANQRYKDGLRSRKVSM